MAFRDQVVRSGRENDVRRLGGAGEAQNRLSDERDRYFRTMRAQDEGGQENTSMTLVGYPAPRNRNELVPMLIPICPIRGTMGAVTARECFWQRCRCGSCDTQYRIDGNCAGVSRNRYRLAG